MMQLLRALYDRVLRWLRTAPPGTVPLTGVLGLAFLLATLYQYRTGSRQRGPRITDRPQQEQGADGGSTAAATSRSAPPTHASSQGTISHAQQSAPKPTQPAAPAIPIASGVRSGLAGVKRVSISVPGVLLLEWQAHELSDSATIRTELPALMQQISAIVDVYLIAHVMDDVGQAAVTGALEECGLLGMHAGGIKPHRVLFCSTLEGKVSIVRQLEPDLHVDGHAATVHELQRFMPQLLHVVEPTGSFIKPPSGPNVAHCNSLHAFFGL